MLLIIALFGLHDISGLLMLDEWEVHLYAIFPYLPQTTKSQLSSTLYAYLIYNVQCY